MDYFIFKWLVIFKKFKMLKISEVFESDEGRFCDF